MRASEFITEKKKRRKRKYAAYGPGSYGWYGYDSGYSGDGGGDGGGESVQHEATYPGNIGMMEVAKFFQIASSEQKQLFKNLLEKDKKGLAWKLIQDITNTKLQGKEFNEVDQHENANHSDNDQAVPQLKSALIAKKQQLQSANDDQVYDIIDKIMAQIAKAHGISGKKLHDMWVDKYKQIPDKWIMKENFADGRNPQDKGDSKRHGVNTKGSVSSLRKTAKQGGRKGQLAHWMANMKSGKAKNK